MSKRNHSYSQLLMTTNRNGLRTLLPLRLLQASLGTQLRCRFSPAQLQRGDGKQGDTITDTLGTQQLLLDASHDGGGWDALLGGGGANKTALVLDNGREVRVVHGFMSGETFLVIIT